MKLLLANPRRKTRAKKRGFKKARKTTVITVSKNPRRKRSFANLRKATKRRSKGFGGSVTTKALSTAKVGAIAGAGALAADIISAKAMQFLPNSMKSGTMQQIAQAAIAILGGMAIEKFVSKDVGQAIAVGGVTVATYNLGRALLVGKGIPGLGGDSDGLLAYDLGENDGLLVYGEDEDSGVNAYDLGAYSNGAPIVGE